MPKCPRCGGNLLMDYENLYCLMCGTFENDTNTPTDIQEQRYLLKNEISNMMADKRIGVKLLTRRSYFKIAKRRKW